MWGPSSNVSATSRRFLGPWLTTRPNHSAVVELAPIQHASATASTAPPTAGRRDDRPPPRASTSPEPAPTTTAIGQAIGPRPACDSSQAPAATSAAPRSGTGRATRATRTATAAATTMAAMPIATSDLALLCSAVSPGTRSATIATPETSRARTDTPTSPTGVVDRAGDVVLAGAVAAWLVILVLILRHRVFVSHDSMSNYGH